MSNISIVIGSWGSYSVCNERVLVRFRRFWKLWINRRELTKEGFELNGIDEALFIQYIDGVDAKDMNCDYIHPKDLF